MSNLTTRKIVLGLLMTLVLAFGVLGNADAIDRLTRNSGDLQTVTAGRDYQIRFTVRIQPPTRGSSYTNYAQTPSANVVAADVAAKTNKTTYYADDYDPDIDSTARGYQREPQVTYDEAHDYEQESITITVSGGAIKKVGSYDVPAASTSLDMYESTHNSYSTTSNPHQRLSGSVTLTLTAPRTPAVVTITIDPTTDGPTGHVDPSNLIFTVYAVGPLNTAGTTGVASATDGVERVSDETDTQIDGHFTFKPAANEPVNYSVEGNGRLYVSVADDRRTSSTNNLYTSSSAPVYLDTSGGSSKVTAYIAGSGDTATVLYLFSGGRLSTLPKIEVQSGSPQPGAPSGQLDDYFEVRVTDGKRRPVSGVPVEFSTTPTSAMFIPVPGTRIYAAAPDEESIDAEVPDITIAEATSTFPATSKNSVQTDRNGVAKIHYQLSSTSGLHTVTAIAYGIGTAINPLSATLYATASSSARAGIANLEIVSGNNQRAEKGYFLTDDLVVIVRSLAGDRVPDVIIQFRTTTGILVPASGTSQPTASDDSTLGNAAPSNAKNPTRGQQIYVKTSANGEAGVTYNVGQLVVARDVVAEVRHEAGETQYDFAIDRVVFNVNGRAGTGSGGGGGGGGGSDPTNTITITLSSTTGEPGDEIDVTVDSSPSAVVVIDSGDLDDADFSRLFRTTPFDTVITLPDEEGEYDFSAEAPEYTSDSATVTVEAELGTLSITALGSPEAGEQTFSISALDADGDRAIGVFTARLSGTGFTSRNVEISDGRGNARVTLPTAARLYTLAVSATGYTDGSTPVRIAAGGQVDDAADDAADEPADDTTAAEPDSISIIGPAARSGTVNEELEAALIVQVLDDDDDGIEGARVFYRVISGRGRLSDRGNGRAIGVITDEDGYARASFTPLDGGTITVRANTDDLSATVEFTITTGSAPTTRDAGTGSTPGTISPVVHVAAANRPPMLWVDGGAIYALVGASPQRFAASVDNALNITVAGGKVYWTEKTGESGGTINSANLNGSGVTELASILAVPMGIAVDVAGSKLYWTNSRGRIQSANLDGSRITNELQDLESPMDIALAGGNAYWTQGNGDVRFVNLRGQKVVRDVSTGTDTPGSLVIGGGKVYWTEMTGESGGTVNSANLNGTGETQLASILAAPMGIAVDGSRSKLYWTNSRGRVQSANLDGSGIKNVVSGLGSPGELVLSNSIATPTATTTTTRTTATASKYDLNSDGTVDNADAALVADAMGTSNTKYDVNGDGTVNFLDLLLVFDNRDPGAAGAPTIVGMKLSAAQIDIIEEQIDLLIATNDRSPAAMRVLVYLQQLLVTARPEKTQLLANYPNPFNPETWIPYELATDTNVRLTIYNTQGVVIRSLQFGHQSAGYYTGRDRAAYWDGRNALGEQVASGLYFYQLETDEMSLMRKMVILK